MVQGGFQLQLSTSFVAPTADDDNLDNLDSLDANHSGLGLDDDFEPDAALLSPGQAAVQERSNPF
jgi:hypothetical protein